MNDLHKAAGANHKDKPSYFLEVASTMELIQELLRSRDSVPLKPVDIVVGKGKEQGTFVSKELVYAYAMWISPQFHLKVIRAYDQLATKGVARVLWLCSNGGNNPID